MRRNARIYRAAVSGRLARNRPDEAVCSTTPGTRVTMLARVLLPILIAGYWAAGWATGSYPLQWSFPMVSYENLAEKTLAGGFSFPERGIAYTETAPPWIGAAIKDNAFQVKIRVRPYNAHQRGPARIFTLSLDHLNRNFTIGQASGSDLVVRLRTSVTGPNGTPGYRLRKVFRDLASHLIVVSVAPRRIRIELDRRLVSMAPLPPNALSTWNPQYRLALGNEFTFSNPWQGAIGQAIVRVGDAEFSYAPTDLRMPKTYVIGMQPYLHKLADSVSYPFNHLSLRNLAVNLIGFLPFGLLLAFVARKPSSLSIACIGCALMSLSIEAGQLFLDARYPSIVDLVLNTTGGCIGAWMGNQIRIFPVRRWLST